MRCSSRARRATLPEPRLAAGVAISALLRRIAGEGGQGTILHRGDPGAGAILILTLTRGRPGGAFERQPSGDGVVLAPVGPADPALLDGYVARRRAVDPDLWVIELEGDGDLPVRIARDVLGG